MGRCGKSRSQFIIYVASEPRKSASLWLMWHPKHGGGWSTGKLFAHTSLHRLGGLWGRGVVAPSFEQPGFP